MVPVSFATLGFVVFRKHRLARFSRPTPVERNAQFQVSVMFLLCFAREAKLCQTVVVLCLRVCDVGKLFCITFYERSKIVPNGVSIRPHHGFALARRMSSEMRLEF